MSAQYEHEPTYKTKEERQKEAANVSKEAVLNISVDEKKRQIIRGIYTAIQGSKYSVVQKQIRKGVFHTEKFDKLMELCRLDHKNLIKDQLKDLLLGIKNDIKHMSNKKEKAKSKKSFKLLKKWASQKPRKGKRIIYKLVQ
jgi:hypothetical protein